jgi:DNA-binding NarL/FixJ family response regulator
MCVYGADDSLRTRALAAGVDSCVEKGANLADVVAVLRAAVQGAAPLIPPTLRPLPPAPA